MTLRTTFLLTTIVVLSLLMIVAIPSVVLSKQAVVEPCAADVAAQCAGHLPGEGRIACIRTRYKDFSLSCQLALVKVAALRKTCKADVKKNCADIKPGGGRIETCLKDHFADVSDRCKETISHAAFGKS